MSEREDEEVAVNTEDRPKRRRRLGPNPRPPSQWGTPDTGRGWGPSGISPAPPSTWSPPVAGGSLGFGGATAERKSALDIANELAAAQTIRATPGGANQFDILGASLGLRQQAVQEPASKTLQDYLLGNQFDPSPYAFDSTPYDNYMNFLMEQDEETMARINAMYAQLAESAEGNMQRIQDIYGSAQRQSGDVFGGSAQNIEDAYASASQQAADQMARLGVEAAAPAVLNPMALSQAEAVSGIERAGAGALDALMRYGTTAQDFGSQMAQVGQQQGLEVTASIMRDMKRRQAEAAFMREQARAEVDREMRQAQAAFNPYARAMQEMEAEQMLKQMQNPQMDWRQQQAMADFESKLEGRDLSTWESYYSRNLTQENGDQQKALARTVWEASMGMLGPGIREQVLNDPELAKYLQ